MNKNKKNEKSKKSKSNIKIEWLSNPEEHDYPAAASYLSLTYDKDTVEEIIKDLRDIEIVYIKAKDLARASMLPLLGPENYHVKKDIKKICDGESISPLLLYKDMINIKLIIADGYHRMCACYYLSEDILIPCKMV